MKNSIKGFLIVFTILSCSKNKKTNTENYDISKTELSSKSIFPDFITLSGSDFAKFEKGNNSKWFKSKSQKLYFLPYADYTITTLVLTTEALKDIDLIELLKADEINVEDSLNAIKTKEFITDKGIKLHVTKEFVEKIYGKSDSTKKAGENEIWFWNFKMNENRKNYSSGNLKPFVHNGLEFSAELTFRNDSLKTLVYKYDVP